MTFVFFFFSVYLSIVRASSSEFVQRQLPQQQLKSTTLLKTYENDGWTLAIKYWQSTFEKSFISKAAKASKNKQASKSIFLVKKKEGRESSAASSSEQGF